MTFRILMIIPLLITAMMPGAFASVEFICKIDRGNPDHIARELNATILDSTADNTYLMSAESFPTQKVKGVAYIEADSPIPVQPVKGAIFRVPSTVPADWYSVQPAMQLIRLQYARFFTTGMGTIIANIDSAIDSRHPALAGRLVYGADFVRTGKSSATLNQSSSAFLDQSSSAFLDQSSSAFLDQSSSSFLDQATASFVDASNPAHGHATMTAGILAAVAPGAQIMPLRAFDDQGIGSVWSIKKAVMHAVKNGAHVINMSFGLATHSRTLESAVAYALRNDVVVVSSAGNNGTAEVQYPAGYINVIGVAATDLLDKKAPFSNYGAGVYVAAPGMNIVSSYPGGLYAVLSGTSFSAPMVAGQAALMRTALVNYGVNFEEYPLVMCVRYLLSIGAVNINAQNPSFAGGLGYGRINLENSKK
jgi:subtilisin family serine protease